MSICRSSSRPRLRKPLTMVAPALLMAACWLRCEPETRAAGSELPAFDFTQAAPASQWEPVHDVAGFEAGGEGVRFRVTGEDPYIVGPPADYPSGTPLVMKIRIFSEAGGSTQLFYFQKTPPVEEKSLRFPVPPGRWVDLNVDLPPLGPKTRLRIDPPGREGICQIASIRFEERLMVPRPAWPAPSGARAPEEAPSVRSGLLHLRHRDGVWGGFELQVAGATVALGHDRQWLGYMRGDDAEWVDLSTGKYSLKAAGDSLLLEGAVVDRDGGTWRLRQRFAPGKPGTIEIETVIQVDAMRRVVFLPALLLCPGMGAYGASKNQGLLAGVEYLENEPSSSTADLNPPASERAVPSSHKITFPLMAIEAGGRYVGLIWEPEEELAALFDSPDRFFGSGAHVMGLLSPGASGPRRADGALIAQVPLELGPEKGTGARAWLIGGEGSSIVPAVQKYVELKGLPPRPPVPSLEAYAQEAAHSWLDTPIREGNLYRHAVWGDNFRPQPAADAAWMMMWLAELCGDEMLGDRLRIAAKEAQDAVPTDALYSAAVSHIRPPVSGLVLGDTAESLGKARQTAEAMLQRIEQDGAVRYRPREGAVDYGRTHFSAEASGMAGLVVAEAIKHAAYSGDRELIQKSLDSLRVLQRFHQGVPRGAQTWEIPLHTPDIMASAHMVRAYALGYMLTAEPAFLDEARYWAWTGVPFVYLRNPCEGPVGAYATIPVLGATNWVAPVWIGLPVQWCGLVYAESLRILAKVDPAGPWLQIAEGIAASGIAQSYPGEHPNRGLLPDSYNLITQSRNGPDINPGTLLPLAIPVLGGEEAYTLMAMRKEGIIIHAPGSLRDASETSGKVAFTVDPWFKGPYRVVVHGAKPETKITVNGKLSGAKQLNPQEGKATVILDLRGVSKVELEP